MKRTIKAVVLTFGLISVSAAQAFSTPPLTPAQQQVARQEIASQLAPGQLIKSVKFGFGPTPPGFIGNGFEHADVTLKGGGTLRFNVSANPSGGVNILKTP
jgi:hypothetical protein